MTDISPTTTLLELLQANSDIIFHDDLRLFTSRGEIGIADARMVFSPRYSMTEDGLRDALRWIDAMRQDREMDRMEAGVDD